uniref:Caspase family p20 domain-containing protein n=1 Tax=Glossina brevipalpis TaxID=37001 RepID=A0A1A9X3B9_9MUSC
MNWRQHFNKKPDNMQNLVKPDPRTKVKTTSAETETTNTTTQNATIFNGKTVIFQSTKQTITDSQSARITEISTRRTPTPEELEEMMRVLHLQKKSETKTFTSSTSATNNNLRRNRPSNLPGINQRNSANGISAKSSTKFKSSASPVARLIFNYESSTDESHSKSPKTPTLVRTEETTVTQKNGRTFTQHVEKKRIKFKLPSPNSPLSRSNYSGEDSSKFYNDAKALLPPITYSPTIKTNSYTSPYTQRNIATVNATKPISNILKPMITTTTTTTPSTKSSSTSTSSSNSLNFSKMPAALSGPVGSLQLGTIKTSSPNLMASGKTVITPPLKPGYAYVFNNFVFDNPNNEQRVGSAEDVKALQDTFEYFKLKVTVIDNAKVDKIRKTVEKVQNKDFSGYACLIIVILSHGSRHEEVAAKDGHYSIDDDMLFPILKNRSLYDKPKIFFIQACKGPMESLGVYKDAVPFQTKGNASEILKCYSTFEGFVSYRSEKGSIFIQTLCQNLKLFGCTKNIKDIIELVTQIVKQQSQNKQIPAYTSTLTKPFVFGDYVKWVK